MKTGGTLIVTKASLRGQWSEELRSKLPNAKNYVIIDYHSGIPAGVRDDLPLADADFVVTNYDIISMQKAHEPDSRSTFTNIWWHRIIFDECHMVHGETSQSKVTANLKATNRWLLSGTPLQPNYSKISGLARALYGIRVNDNMLKVVKSQLNRWLQSTTLRHTVDQLYADSGTKFLEDLARHEDVVVNIKMSNEERLVYETATKRLKAELNQITSISSRWWSQWTLAAMRLRQLTSHVTSVTRDPFSLGIDPSLFFTNNGGGGGSYNWETRELAGTGNNSGSSNLSSTDAIQKLSTLIPNNRISEVTETLQNPTEYECPICFEVCTSLGLTKCGHLFCSPCILPTVSIKGQCPMCRSNLPADSVTIIDTSSPLEEVQTSPAADDEVDEDDCDELGPDPSPERAFKWLKKKSISSKMSAMIKKISDLRKRDSTCKVVIFTQFDQAITAIEREITRIGYTTQKIVGCMSQKQRSESLSRFNSDPTCLAFLLTIRTGSCGLTLTKANHVFLMEPCLNPSLELQAIGRCQRITQTKRVVCHRFIVEDTIESVLHESQSGSKAGSNTSIMTPALLSKYFKITAGYK
eukprot:TRINITY_DN1098_c0_g1_i4.p1 TRINITY_DN1098_c0_g1~~TRINITY_DN1098_c0_g1_i4.p1  ORF type:complete len:582 (+),score=106.64 TRINITY_DN1098_c0_g1_i4:522-2267(+)